MPQGKESKIEKELRLYMESKGGTFPKSVSPGLKGWPDRNPSHPFCGPFYMEVKRPAKYASELQLERAKEMARFGYRVYTSVNQVRIGKEIIDDEIAMLPPSQRRHQPVSPNG